MNPWLKALKPWIDNWRAMDFSKAISDWRSQMTKAEQIAEHHVWALAPQHWFDDPHERGSRPLCCEAIQCVRYTLNAVPNWDGSDVRALALVIIGGLKSLEAACHRQKS